MSTIINIAINELKRLFLSPFPWIILATTQSLLAYYFYLGLSKFIEPASIYSGRSFTETIVLGLLDDTGIALLFISPFVTMRLISEELRSGTIKLLLSSPINVTELVLGKYLGIMSFYFGLLVMVSLMPLSLAFSTKLDFGLLASGLIGLILLCSAFTAIGMFISSLSKSPAIAALCSFFSLSLLWIIHVVNESASESFQSVFNYISLKKHFYALLSGVFGSADVIFYLLVSALFIALSIWRIDAIRTHQ
jgi:ABC-2 type transport system permease protein